LKKGMKNRVYELGMGAKIPNKESLEVEGQVMKEWEF